MFEVHLAATLGFIFITIIDRVWFQIDYKKAEKGLEVLEHFHYGIALLAISFIFVESIPSIAYALMGMGTAFIYRESRQKNAYSYTSTHFKPSLIIGLGLCVVTAFSYLYLLTEMIQ